MLRSVGKLIRDRLLGSTPIANHLQAAEARAQLERRRLRLLLEVDEEEDSILAKLPIELAYDGTGFVFKRPGKPSFRCPPHSEARNLRLRAGARVLIATAHADNQPEPSRDTLREHAEAIATAVTSAGFLPSDRRPRASPACSACRSARSICRRR